MTNPTEALAGRPSRSSSQPAATASTAEAAGAAIRLPAFCPQAAVSQSAATPVGCDPPITQPKNRGPVIGRMPGVARATRSSMIVPASSPVSGVGPANASSIWAWGAVRVRSAPATFCR